MKVVVNATEEFIQSLSVANRSKEVLISRLCRQKNILLKKLDNQARVEKFIGKSRCMTHTETLDKLVAYARHKGIYLDKSDYRPLGFGVSYLKLFIDTEMITVTGGFDYALFQKHENVSIDTPNLETIPVDKIIMTTDQIDCYNYFNGSRFKVDDSTNRLDLFIQRRHKY